MIKLTDQLDMTLIVLNGPLNSNTTNCPSKDALDHWIYSVKTGQTVTVYANQSLLYPHV